VPRLLLRIAHFSGFVLYLSCLGAGRAQDTTATVGQTLSTVLTSASEDFRTLKGTPDLRVGKAWTTETKIPGTDSCRIWERDGFTGYECQTRFAGSEELAQRRYQDFVAQIQRGLGNGWSLDSDPAITGIDRFNKGAIFVKGATFVGHTGYTSANGLTSVTLTVRVFEETNAITSKEGGGPKSFNLTVLTKNLIPQKAPDQPATGQRRPSIGLLFHSLDEPSVLKAFGADNGVLVSDVQPGGPAFKAGLRRSDVILAFNGTPIWDALDLISRLGILGAEKPIKVRYLRDNKISEAAVVPVSIVVPAQSKLLSLPEDFSQQFSEVVKGSATQFSQLRGRPQTGKDVPGTDQGYGLASILFT
jgi:hypothetical protein